MAYWTQILTYPSLLIGPVLLAAVISGVVAILVGRSTRKATSGDVDRKIASERALTDAKFAHERDSALTDRAWADYGLRRDVYLELAARIGCLFLSVQATQASTNHAEKAEFHKTTRKVRLIGSDAVVGALNNLTFSIKNGAPHNITSENYSILMNAIRLDIRTLNENPAVGTSLDPSAFPLEG